MRHRPDDAPLYKVVADTLAADIVGRRRGVGEMLPTEGELCTMFGVSRATVREALRRLREAGLVAGARGVGTRVVADRMRSGYVLAARSVADVMGYTDPLWLDIAARRLVRTTAPLASRLGCDAGTGFWHVAGTRRAGDGGPALSCVDLYIAAEFADAANSAELVSTPAYRLIGRDRGVHVAEVRQEVAAVALTRSQAETLGDRPGRPGLFIRRRYYAADGRLIEATLNVHGAADRFTYSLHLGPS